MSSFLFVDLWLIIIFIAYFFKLIIIIHSVQCYFFISGSIFNYSKSKYVKKHPCLCLKLKKKRNKFPQVWIELFTDFVRIPFHFIETYALI